MTCGGRDQTHDAFLNATRLSPGVINFLLVDSEGPVGNPGLPRAHLKHCDGWELASISEAAVHLMVQLMEAWLLADSDTVAAYYGQHFLKAAIPSARNLERVDKAQIEDALKRATARTTKGEYQKIRDAAALLQRIDPQIVRSRCPSCARLFLMLDRAIRAPE